MNNFKEKANFIFGIANLIRDTFNRGKYRDVILPFTVLRRIDYVLEPTKKQVLEEYEQFKDSFPEDALGDMLRETSKYAFYNTSKFTFEGLLEEDNLAANLKNYINGFSKNMRDVLEKFDFQNTVKRLDESGLLFLVMERFKSEEIDLHPDSVFNPEMGDIFQELIRKFNEALNEHPGEHFTPPDVVRLMVSLLLCLDEQALTQDYIELTVYDPCCGTGGMLIAAKKWIEAMNLTATVRLYGQEVNPETYAVCKSDLYILSADGRDAEQIMFGSTLANPQHHRCFDYMLANPPYGKKWQGDKKAVEVEKKAGGRFDAGLPRIKDGQLLFLQDMLSRMQEAEQGGSRVGIVMNGSPLFTGDAGSGESEIRRWILENDWLEAIVALPEQLFYNTGITTYIWILTNKKQPQRERKVQLINANGTDFWVQMPKSMGDKRRQISNAQIDEITELYEFFKVGEKSKHFDTTDFGYRKITVERPLRLNFQASDERIVRLKDEKAFQDLPVSKKRKAEDREAEEAAGRRQQQAILEMLSTLPGDLYKDRDAFVKVLNKAIKAAGIEVKAPLKKAILSALSERDETAEICRDKDGKPEPDPQLQDTENVPLKEDIWEYFEREVKPHVPDAWVNTEVCDDKDGQVGKVGYQINFNRYFYQYHPPRLLEEIEADIKVLEKDILEMLREVAG
jgi:type I restriction enzyme M protein